MSIASDNQYFLLIDNAYAKPAFTQDMPGAGRVLSIGESVCPEIDIPSSPLQRADFSDGDDGRGRGRGDDDDGEKPALLLTGD